MLINRFSVENIKPSNILVKVEANGFSTKIIDKGDFCRFKINKKNIRK